MTPLKRTPDPRPLWSPSSPASLAVSWSPSWPPRPHSDLAPAPLPPSPPTLSPHSVFSGYSFLKRAPAPVSWPAPSPSLCLQSSLNQEISITYFSLQPPLLPTLPTHLRVIHLTFLPPFSPQYPPFIDLDGFSPTDHLVLRGEL